MAIYLQRGRQQVISTGRNCQPAPFVCDGGSPRCREVCGKRCVHAERRALDGMLSMLGGFVPQVDREPSDLDLVHVKLGTDGRVIAGGGPSCWQCSREILDVGIGGVWLYEAMPEEWCPHTDMPRTECSFCQGADCIADRGKCDTPGPCDHDVIDRHGGLPVVTARWRRYGAEEFHRVTLRNCGMEGP